MGKFKIEWTEEVWYRMEVEADSYDDAREKFWAGEYNLDNGTQTGGECQDSVEIEEIEEVA